MLKHWEHHKNTDFDIREFLGIGKALQSIQAEVINNTSKVMEINIRIKKILSKIKYIFFHLTISFITTTP